MSRHPEPRFGFGCCQSVSLDNFNPFSPSRRFTSPRSIAVCRAHGISPDSLFHKTYEEVKRTLRRIQMVESIVSPARRADACYVRMKFVERERARLGLLEKLKAMRLSGDNAFFAVCDLCSL